MYVTRYLVPRLVDGIGGVKIALCDPNSSALNHSPLFCQSVRSFFWNDKIVVHLSTPATAIDVDEGVDHVVECASLDLSNICDMVSVHGYPVKPEEEDWEGMETDANAESRGSEGAVIGSSP